MSREGVAKARYDARTIRRTIAKNRARLLQLRNVVHVGVGRKVARGQRAAKLAIRIFVRRKTGVVARRDRVPKRLRAVGPNRKLLNYYIPTDVEERPRRFRALAVKGGDAIFGRTQGTLGLAYVSHSGRVLLLTNAHVVSPLNSGGIGRPVFISNGGTKSRVGSVTRMLRIRTDRMNEFDGALIAPTADADLLLIAPPPIKIVGHGRLSTGSTARFTYFSNGRRIACTDPESLESTVEIVYPDGVAEFANAVELDVVAGSSIQGHSGALLVRESSVGAVACGLVFAGDGRRVLVTPIERLLHALSAPAASDDGSAEDVRVQFQ